MTSSTTFAPTCSVVVCTRNRPEALDRCLRALAQLTYPRFEVLVVDNAPRDGGAQAIAQRWRAQYLVERIAGLSRARNAGARACRGEVVAFTDDDAIPDRAWLSQLAAAFSDANVAVVTGRTLPFVSADTAVAPEHTTDLGPELIRLDRSHSHWFEVASFGGIGNGNNMAFRRRVFDGPWSGFDERLGRGAPLSSCEEHRAFAQLVDQGHTIVYAPNAIVRHPIPQMPAERRAEYLRSRADLAGYAAFLLLTTRYKWKVTKYVIEAAQGKTRAWRFRTGILPPGIVPRWQVLTACVAGLWRCVKACVRSSGRRHPTAGARTDAEADVLPGGQPAG